jgi:hypothetical protein
MRQGGRLDRAKQDAVQALSSVRGEDRGVVLAFASTVHLMNEATADVSTLRGAIQAIQPTVRAAHAELARSLRRSRKAHMPVEAIYFRTCGNLPGRPADARLAEARASSSIRRRP